MTDETPIPQETPAKPDGEAPRARRTPAPRAKKQAKASKSQAGDPGEPAPAPAPAKEPVIETISETIADTSSSTNDWPDPEPASSGGSSGNQENNKRKRRRKKGKGNKPQNAATPVEADTQDTEESTDAPAPAQEGPRPQGGQHTRPQQAQRPKPDSELVAKLACKIYLAEISEEGIALIGDNDARELSRRCFRLAEIFLEEQSRRR